MDTFQKYFKEIRKRHLTGDSTEHTLRTPFENFIHSIDEKFRLIQEPKGKHKLGIPDFKAFRKSIKIGYIETKDLGKNLDKELKSEQIEKYKKSINNIILTDYSRFILIRNSEEIFDFDLFSLSDLQNSKHVISEDKIEKFSKMIQIFFDYNIQTIKSPKELARELSKRAKLLKDLAKEQLEEDLSESKNNEKTSSTSSVYDFYQGIKELIKDINIDDCADAYSQTITYGLFLAKINSPNSLDRKTASSYIPQNIGIIKRIFVNIGYSLPSNISWIVDEIVDILNASDIKNILSEIDSRDKKDRDPFTFFYEDFLSLYNPKKRKRLGVYYTPRPVVNFIVNSVDQILKKDFNKPRGFAEDDVTVLDPAIGTGTFFWIAFNLTILRLMKTGLSGLKKKKIENHLLKDFYGFEILITPYIISHLKLTTVLKKWYYEFKENDRIQVYLTNTLEPTETHDLIPFLKELNEESRNANEIKSKRKILAIIGNPPYSVSSSNKSDWIMEKMKDYKKNLNERNIQPLDDDYIKFIRFAQWKIEQNEQGVIGFITNNSYLDGIIHRQMRKELLDTFDRIYILNLHGNSRKKETCPDGSKDENVFDIQQGVAVVLFIKNKKYKDKKIFYKDLYGTRDYKYKWLDKPRNLVYSAEWKELKPKKPYYFFVKKDEVSEKITSIYQKAVKLTSIFSKYSIGIVSGSDKTRVSFEKNDNQMFPYDYRPFDKRYINLFDKSIQRPRLSIMNNFLKENIGLVSSKQSRKGFKNVFVTKNFACKQFISDASYIFPLYIHEKDESKVNFSEEFKIFLKENYPNKKILSEDVLGYIYSVLHSSEYREKFNEFLKVDFPRVPFSKNFEIFKKLSKLGKELLEIHLMTKKIDSKIKFDIDGSNIVENVKYENKKVYINKEQFFDDIPKNVWNFYIGDYKVLEKWLKVRKSKELKTSEIEKFIQIVEAIRETMKCMKKIDEIKFF